MIMDNRKLARRDFFRKTFQWSILSAMVGTTAYLALEERISPIGCSETQFCRNCQKIEDCTLDQAKNFRQDGKQ